MKYRLGMRQIYPMTESSQTPFHLAGVWVHQPEDIYCLW